MNAHDILLLSTVHNGDVALLQSHLSSISDPNVYLNRVYDETDEQKCTLLMIACLNGYEDIVYMLLNYFDPDLEVLNVIQINDNEYDPEIYQNVTVLWATVANNRPSIVKVLIEHGARINHTTDTNSTPIRCACYTGNVDMARYLIENGADIHINKKNNETNLALSVYCKRSKMTAYLVDELGCDVNECDTANRSPLYFAVKCGSLEMVQLLLNRGARNFLATHNRMSPLMLAAEKRSHNLMNVIVPYCSTIEQIEAEELLGSAFACAEHGLCDLQKSFEHYYRAVQLRSIHNFPKVLRESTIEIFNNRQECQTVNQLEELRSNPKNMYIEALLVRERLLGPANEEYRYSVIYRGAILADNTQYDRAIVLWMYELELRQQYSIAIDPQRLRRFTSIFVEMVSTSLSVPVEAILAIITATVEEVRHNIEKVDYNLHTLLFLTTITSQPSIQEHFSTTDRRVIYRLIHSVNHDQYSTLDHGSSLLHSSLNSLTSASDSSIDNTCKCPCLSTVRTLFQCGADVNATDVIGNTPLRIFASNASLSNQSVLQLLCDAGAHLDYTNALGETPIDVALNLMTKQLLKGKTKINLKCLCARLIRQNDIPCYGKISTSLVSFVERH